MRHFFVINPHSFRTLGSLKRILMDLENCFSVGRRMEYKIYISRHPRDAIAAVHRYMISVPYDETVRVYAVGGDGILFDCLNGMVNFPNAELTSVPYGSANDFVRTFGKTSRQAFRDIKKLSVAPSRPVDIIHCGANYALIEVNIGLIGLTVYHANKLLRGSSKWIHRYTSSIYNLSGVRSLINSEVQKQGYSIKMDDIDMSGDYCNIHIANVPCDGGSNVPSPYSIPDDGELEAIFIRPGSKLDLARKINDRNKGYFEKHDMFVYKKCRTMDIESEAPLCVQMDGEAFFARDIKLKIVPKGIKFFAPEGLSFTDYSYMAYNKRKVQSQEESGK